ncbi:hypothetical protein QWZ06_08730 [Chryseobacterium tructae]|uniref:hypothetical protein n=1 Tax=Chryseobacterium tructae TaxID=1037380 RepID=UPI0025B4322E|nr:hypothetical protein [Chryseobacterium tructae]MDN3692342.1 hypothetical protein [Chryseobacterium tructae]
MEITFRQLITGLSIGLFTNTLTMAQSHHNFNLNHHIMENQLIHYRNIKVNDVIYFTEKQVLLMPQRFFSCMATQLPHTCSET